MKRTPHFSFWASLILALVLHAVALPEAVAPARPLWLPLTIAYWAMTEPRVPTMLAALLFGLLMDVMFNATFGQHAAGLVTVAFLVIRLRGLFVMFPLWQTTLALAPVWAVFAFLMFWIDGITRHRADALLRWLPVLSTTLFWPLVYALLDAAVRRRRREE